MKTEDELPIIRLWYEFLLWLLPKVGKFPRDMRHSLGEKIEGQSLHILELLIRAKFRKDREGLLDETNTELQILRFELRLAHDLKALPPKAYGQAWDYLLDIGRQVGNWQNSIRRKQGP